MNKFLLTVMIAGLSNTIVAQEKVTFETDDGVKIVGTYTKAVVKDEKKSAPPGVVLIHMLRKNRSDWNNFAKELSNAGYAVLAIDIRGHGESTKQKTSEKELEWSDLSGKEFNMATNDVKAGVEYLKKQGVDAKRIAIIGASIGANIALNYAASDEDIKAVALLSPGLEYHGVQTEDAMKTYGKRPVLIVASKDDAYSFDSAEKLFGIAEGEKQELAYEKSGHGTNIFGKEGKDEPKLNKVILDWLVKNL